jgi:hypothetical protein
MGDARVGVGDGDAPAGEKYGVASARWPARVRTYRIGCILLVEPTLFPVGSQAAFDRYILGTVPISW